MGVRGENEIGTRVRAARQRLGWNRETLAFHSGISWSAIAQVETGRRTNLRPTTLHSLSRALGVTIDYLVAGGGWAAPMLAHRALLYETDAEFLEIAVPFLAEGVERGEAVLAVTTDAKIELLRDGLGEAARKVEFAERSSWYRTPTEALAAYREFLDARLKAGAPWVRILGEPPWNSDSHDQLRMWVRYEALLNLAFAAEPVSLTCPYDKRGVDDEVVGQARATHPHIAERGGPRASADYADPFNLVLEP